MYLNAIGTALPERRYTKSECWDAFAASQWFERLDARSRLIAKHVLTRNNGIEARRLSVASLKDVFSIDADTLNRRFSLHAPALASGAGCVALQRAGIAAESVDAVIVSTCTGYLCPGLTSYVSEQLGLRENVFALDLVGQGCGAALPNLRAAESILAAGRAKKILSVCVEICSAAFFLDDDPGVLISACLFADGAGAAVLSDEPQKNRRRVEWKFASSNLAPDKRDALRFSHKNGMLRNILSPQVPQVAGEIAEKLFSESLDAVKIKRGQITGWILHTGGRDVILSLREKLNLTEADVRHSSAVLREFGNISSPTVYFVLQAALNDSVPGGLWWMSAFGAGFSCHGAFLEVG